MLVWCKFFLEAYYRSEKNVSWMYHVSYFERVSVKLNRLVFVTCNFKSKDSYQLFWDVV
jgi:hypothetical protein